MIKPLESKSNRPILLLVISLIVLVCFSIIVALAGFFLGNILKTGINSGAVNLTELSARCLNQGGNWVGSSKECEKVSEPFCRSLGGIFDACASPCRNKSGQVMCVQMCVQVCTFK